MPVWKLGNLVYQENRHGAASLVYPEEPNAPPSIEMTGSSRRTAKPAEPITLSVEVADDGSPKPLARPRSAARSGGRSSATSSIRTQSPFTQAVVKLDPGVRLGVTWVVYRGGPGTVTFNPMRVAVVSSDSSSSTGRIAGKASTSVTFSKPGTYVLRAYADDSVLLTPLDITVTVADSQREWEIEDDQK
jgi:hypothetical protein